MTRLAPVVLAVLVFGSAVAGSTSVLAAGSASAGPSVEITVDGSPVSDGERHETPGSVRLTVSATADNGTTLEEVVVRIDGEQRAARSLDGTSATENIYPDLQNGNNTVRVIVTDSAGDVNATRFTIFRDGEAPHVFLESPYQTAPWHDIPDGTAEGSKVTLSGRVIEDSTVDRLTVVHTYGDSYRNVTVRKNVTDTWSVPLKLGYTGLGDANTVRIEVSDEFGNARTYEFQINTTDGGPPEVSVRPFPNRTGESQFYFAGTVEDDVWVDQVTVTVEGPDGNVTDTTRQLSDRAYTLEADRFAKSFNESVHVLYAGTYEITVNATDVTGESTIETYTVERVPYDEGGLTPTVEVDRDRTVVTDADTLFLSGAAYDGMTERLVVETRNTSSGETLDYQVIYDGNGRDRVDFDRDVSIGAGRTTVIVRAMDPNSNEVSTRFVVDAASQDTFVGNETSEAGETDSWPAVTVTPLQDSRPGTASASVRVERAGAGETVAVPPVDGRDAVAETANVSLDELTLSVSEQTNLTGTVVVRDRSAGVLQAPADVRPAATVSIQHSASETVSGLTLRLSVDRAYLDARRFDPDNLTLYRLSGGEWRALDTAVVGQSDGTVRVRADAPGLSVFSLGPTAPNARNETIGTETTTNGTVGNDTTGNGTIANGTAGNATATNETASTVEGGQSGDGGEPQIFVSNVTVNRTQVAVNESVLVNVTLTNSGTAEGTYVAGLQTIHGLNRTFVAEKRATVAADGDAKVQFTTNFSVVGNHTVSVNGTQGGPVVVSQGGGLLSVFSVLPLRLIGIALGGIVGLIVVLTLVRFVLGRVGGGGEEASG